MLAYTEGDVIIDGIKIHYYRTGGSKPPFVLLHGATDNGLCWTPVAELLAERYDVVMPDAQGHGLSDRLDPDFTVMNHTIQAIGLIRELELTSPFIMGHSLGADTAVHVAAEHPLLPKAIILEDPAWRPQESINADDTGEGIKQNEAFMNALSVLRQRTREELIVEGRDRNPRWSEAEIILWADAKLQFDATLFKNLDIDRHSYEDLIPKIVCPTLLITSGDGMVTPETVEHASRLWNSEQPFKWVQIKDAGHNIHREQFGIFIDTVFRFLQTCPD